MSKTSFESNTLGGGRCFFYLEDVTNAELYPEDTGTAAEIKKSLGLSTDSQIVVKFINDKSVQLPGSEYDRLVGGLKSIDTNQL